MNDNNMNEYKDIIYLMETTPEVPVPDGFTQSVMARLTEAELPYWVRLRRVLGQGTTFDLDLHLGFRKQVSKTECAFYFLLTGFFYLVLGFIMMFGLQRLAGLLHPGSGWLSVQPLFGLLLAVGLAALGFVLYTNGRSAVRVARIGTVLYAALVFLNGWIGALWTHVPATVFFAAIFSVTGLGMAAFLGIAVDRYTPETISSQGVRA